MSLSEVNSLLLEDSIVCRPFRGVGEPCELVFGSRLDLSSDGLFFFILLLTVGLACCISSPAAARRPLAPSPVAISTSFVAFEFEFEFEFVGRLVEMLRVPTSPVLAAVEVLRGLGEGGTEETVPLQE